MAIRFAYAEDVRQRPLPGREIRLNLRQALIIENPRHHEPHGKRQGKALRRKAVRHHRIGAHNHDKSHIQAYEQLAVPPAPVAYGRRDVEDGGEHGKDHRPPQPFLPAVPDEPPADQYRGQQQPDDGQANLARADPAVLDDFRAPDRLVGNSPSANLSAQ